MNKYLRALHSITTKAKPQHRERHALLFTIGVWVLLRPLLTILTLKMQETGPTVYSPYPRRLESLTTFSSVILRPWVLVRPESNSQTSRVTARCSTNWATVHRYWCPGHIGRRQVPQPHSPLICEGFVPNRANIFQLCLLQGHLSERRVLSPLKPENTGAMLCWQ